MILPFIVDKLLGTSYNLSKSSINKISQRIIGREIFKKKLSDLTQGQFNDLIKKQFKEAREIIKDVLSVEGESLTKIEEINNSLLNSFQNDLSEIKTNQQSFKEYLTVIQGRIEQSTMYLDESIKNYSLETISEMKNLQWSLLEQFTGSIKEINKQIVVDIKEEVRILHSKLNEELRIIVREELREIFGDNFRNSFLTNQQGFENVIIKSIEQIPKRKGEISSKPETLETPLTSEDWETFQEAGIPDETIRVVREVLSLYLFKIKNHEPDLNLTKLIYKETKYNRINIKNLKTRIIQFYIPKEKRQIKFKLLETSSLSEETKKIINNLPIKEGDRFVLNLDDKDDSFTSLNQLFTAIIPNYYK